MAPSPATRSVVAADEDVRGAARTSSATLVIRQTDSGFSVAGPTNFAGGNPPLPNGEREGDHGEWHWDGSTLEARVDRLGLFPLYYSELSRGVAISTSISRLIEAGASAAIDWSALQVLLRLGYHVACDTVFRAIKAFPVGGRLVWRPGSLRVTEAFPDFPSHDLTRDAAIDGYIDVFRAAIRKRNVQPERIHLPLSGGRDSRHILLELVAAGSSPACCFTSRYATMADDVRIARELCGALKVPHVETPSPETADLVALEHEKNELVNFQILEGAWIWLVARALAHEDAVVYDGIGGDVLSAGSLRDDERRKLYAAGRFEDLARILAPPGPMLMPARLRDRLAAVDPYEPLITELGRYRNTHNPLLFFFLFNRTRRAVATGLNGVWRSMVKAAHAPYLDGSVVDFLAGLPPSTFADRTFHTEAIARAHPAQAHVPYAPKGGPIRKEMLSRYARQGLALALSHSSPLLDRAGAAARFALGRLTPEYRREAFGYFHSAVMLEQLGALQRSTGR